MDDRSGNVARAQEAFSEFVLDGHQRTRTPLLLSLRIRPPSDGSKELRANGERVAMSYQLLQATTRYEIVEMVRAAMSVGWKPIGGVAVSSRDSGGVSTYTQAMIEETAQDKHPESKT
jgi:hypothetical protein